MHYLPSTIPDEAIEALRPAFDRSYVHQVDHWIERCKAGTAQLWRHGDYWAITEVLDGKDGRICHEFASAGVYADALIDEIEAWARSVGCKRVLCTVRPGLTRKRLGYRTKAITLEKEL